jgi:hypothetical protein
VVLGTLYGRELARHATGVPIEELILPVSPINPVRFHAFSGIGVDLLQRWYRFLDRRELRARPAA